MHFSDHKIYIELFGPLNIYLAVGIQIVSALILGGIVGFDREIKMKSAGLKTNIMICVGSTLYTTISLLSLAGSESLADPNRMSAQIVSGIGFLGAGAIIQGRGSVIGLTTAATIWVVAAIGYTIGVGYPFVAGIFTITVVLILKMLSPLNKVLERTSEHKDFHIQVLTSGETRHLVSKVIFNESHIELDEMYYEVSSSKKEKMIINIFLKGHPRAIERIVKEIDSLIKVEKCSYRQIDNAEDIMEMYSEKKMHE